MLIRSGMVANTSGSTALSLEMPAGKAARIREFHAWYKITAAEDYKVTIDRKSVMQLKSPAYWHTYTLDGQDFAYPIADEFRQAGLWPVIPLGEGETLGITAPGTGKYLEVVYDLYDAADVSPTEPNGSKSSVYRMFQLISNSGTRATAGDLALDQSDLDTQYPAFPGGDTVPPNTTMSLLGLFGSAWTKGSGSANGEYTTYIKMLADREDILDLALAGMTWLGDSSYVAYGCHGHTDAGRLMAGSYTTKPRIVVFDTPIEFRGGSELNVYATIGRTGSAADFSAGQVKLGMIFDVARV